MGQGGGRRTNWCEWFVRRPAGDHQPSRIVARLRITRTSAGRYRAQGYGCACRAARNQSPWLRPLAVKRSNWTEGAVPGIRAGLSASIMAGRFTEQVIRSGRYGMGLEINAHRGPCNWAAVTKVRSRLRGDGADLAARECAVQVLFSVKDAAPNPRRIR